jgi:septum formation protein
MTKLILASQSAIRAKLLKKAGLNFEIIAANIDETYLQKKLNDKVLTPEETAQKLAEEKAKTIAKQYPNNLVIGADQILIHQGKSLTKQVTKQAIIERLHHLSGTDHRLFSAYSLQSYNRNGEPIISQTNYDSAILTMRDLTSQTIEYYVAKNKDTLYHSVGCYCYEQDGIQLFDTIKGDEATILGMPILKVLKTLRSIELTMKEKAAIGLID